MDQIILKLDYFMSQAKASASKTRLKKSNIRNFCFHIDLHLYLSDFNPVLIKQPVMWGCCCCFAVMNLLVIIAAMMLEYFRKLDKTGNIHRVQQAH